jgi:hypothetical protein
LGGSKLIELIWIDICHKTKSKLFHPLFEHLFANNIENSSEIECHKFKSNINSGPFHGSFGCELVKNKLTINCSIRMLQNVLFAPLDFFSDPHLIGSDLFILQTHFSK